MTALTAYIQTTESTEASDAEMLVEWVMSALSTESKAAAPDAQALRELAAEYSQTQSSFASDLLAAADAAPSAEATAVH